MKQQDVVPNVIAYSALISACKKGKQCEEALGLLKEMAHQLLMPDVVSYIAACSSSSHLWLKPKAILCPGLGLIRYANENS